MVKIAAKLITRVATVIPERAGLRRKLSDAKRVSAHEMPGKRTADCQNQRTAKAISNGQKKANPKRKTSMPKTPTLNLSTDPFTVGARTKRSGARTKHAIPSRLAQDVPP